MVRKMILVFSLTEAGEQQIGWVFGKYQATMGAVGKACHICQTSMPKSPVQLPNISDKSSLSAYSLMIQIFLSPLTTLSNSKQL